MDDGWIEYRRTGDDTLLGWIRVAGDGFVAVDLLGRERTGEVDWLAAEEALDALGIAYLAERYELRREPGERRRVRIVEVTGSMIRVRDDTGDVAEAPRTDHLLAWPVPDEVLRAVRA